MTLMDTDVLIDVVRGSPAALTWLSSLPKRPSVSGFAALELAFGSQNLAELANVRRFLASFRIIWPSERQVSAAIDLAAIKLSSGLGVIDAMTSALAPDLGAALATFNVWHFSNVPGLAVSRPYTR